MEDLVILTEGIGVFKILVILAACAAASAYVLLSRGIAAAVITISIISFGWVKLVGGDAPPGAVFCFWYIMNWVYTLAFIGLLRIGALVSARRVRLFSTDIPEI